MLFFYTFPGGNPGIGLLLLRAAIGGAAIVEGVAYLAKPDNSVFGMWVVGLLAVVSGALLLVGFLTKATSALAGLSSVALSWVPALPLNSFDTKLSLFFVIVMTVSIILLGPGAFSLDSRLFGRREIIIPHNTRPPNS